jgi:hypothetical protein
MPRWQQRLTEVDRVRERTDDEVLSGLDAGLRARVEGYRDADEATIGRRLEELDREWDVERLLIVNASSLVTLGALLSLRRRGALALPLVVGSFLLQHGLQGWCPPLTLFRRLGVRTRREIDLERYALKTLRGDLSAEAAAGSSADGILELAVRR